MVIFLWGSTGRRLGEKESIMAAVAQLICRALSLIPFPDTISGSIPQSSL